MLASVVQAASFAYGRQMIRPSAQTKSKRMPASSPPPPQVIICALDDLQAVASSSRRPTMANRPGALLSSRNLNLIASGLAQVA
jgi:hypothetical protein